MTTTTPDLTGTFAIDAAHSRIGFVARHAMITKVRGSFNDFGGTANLDVENLANTHIDLEIEVASVDTRNADRDAHLRNNDFFDAATYPRIRFVSTGVRKTGENDYVLTGDLTIKSVTKSVDVDFEFTGLATDPYGNVRAGFEGKTTINRKDWGVNFNAALEAGGVLVSDKIALEFDISAIRG
ncbi:MAG: YceI family protein [Sporichthyaceae bacterium]